MAKLIIKRLKRLKRASSEIICYVNGETICVLKNGEETICEINSGLMEFKCNYPNFPMSSSIIQDMTYIEALKITVMSEILIECPRVTFSDVNDILEPNKLQESNVEGKNAFIATKSVGGYFGVNEETKQWAIGKGLVPSLSNAAIFSYNDIIDFEFFENGSSIVKGGGGSVGTALPFFGGNGMLISSLNAPIETEQTCTSLNIKITINNMDTPTAYINLISSPTNKEEFAYTAAFRNAQEILSILQLICKSCQSENVSEDKTTTAQEWSAADEIRKFKELLDEGIITDEEFKAKKKQLLEEN